MDLDLWLNLSALPRHALVRCCRRWPCLERSLLFFWLPYQAQLLFFLGSSWSSLVPEREREAQVFKKEEYKEEFFGTSLLANEWSHFSFAPSLYPNPLSSSSYLAKCLWHLKYFYVLFIYFYSWKITFLPVVELNSWFGRVFIFSKSPGFLQSIFSWHCSGLWIGTCISEQDNVDIWRNTAVLAECIV